MNTIDWSTYTEKGYLNEEDLSNLVETYSNFFNTLKINNFNKFNVLEFGAGHGKNTILFYRLFNKILATEPNTYLHSELSNKIMKDKLSSKIKTQQIDVESFQTSNKFDIIVLANVFLFIENKQKALLKFSNLLKKKKYLLISEPFIFFSYKYNNQKLLQESVIAINNTKKFEIIYIGLVGLDKWIYLLKLK